VPAVQTDLKNIWTDLRTRNTTQLATDRAQLTTDLTTLTTDLEAPKAQLLADRKTFETQEQTDRQALQDLINSDPTVAPLYAAVKADQDTYTADLATLQADKMSFITARNLVFTDIMTLKTDIAQNL